MGKIADIWKDLTAQLKVHIEEVGDYISESHSSEQGESIKDQLIKLGELRDIFDDNKLQKNYAYAKKIGTNILKLNLLKIFIWIFV